MISSILDMQRSSAVRRRLSHKGQKVSFDTTLPSFQSTRTLYFARTSPIPAACMRGGAVARTAGSNIRIFADLPYLVIFMPSSIIEDVMDV